MEFKLTVVLLFFRLNNCFVVSVCVPDMQAFLEISLPVQDAATIKMLLCLPPPFPFLYSDYHLKKSYSSLPDALYCFS